LLEWLVTLPGKEAFSGQKRHAYGYHLLSR